VSRTLAVAAAAASLVLAPAAAARDEAAASSPRELYITPFFGYQWGGGLGVEGGQLDIPSGPSYGAIVSLRVRADAKAELLYSREDTSVEYTPDSTARATDLGDLAIQYFQIGGLLELEHGRARPFVSGLLGLTWFDPSGDLDETTKFSGGLGIGVQAAVSDRVGLRVEGKGWINFFDASGSLFCGSNGCLVQGSASTMTQGEVLGGLSVRL
jgi:hypothetical protein